MNEKGGKKPRVWGYGDPNMDVHSLDRSKDKADDATTNFSPDAEVICSFSLFVSTAI